MPLPIPNGSGFERSRTDRRRPIVGRGCVDLDEVTPHGVTLIAELFEKLELILQRAVKRRGMRRKPPSPIHKIRSFCWSSERQRAHRRHNIVI